MWVGFNNRIGLGFNNRIGLGFNNRIGLGSEYYCMFQWCLRLTKYLEWNRIF